MTDDAATTYRGLVDEDMDADGLSRRLDGAVDLDVGGPNDEAALAEALSGKDVVFTTSRLPVSRRVLEATDLSLVAKIGTGIDNVDLAAARERGIPVTYTPGMNAMSVAEHTVLLLLATNRRVMVGRDLLREGRWRDELAPGTQLYGKTVGIVGFGNVGRRTAALLSGFQPRLLAYDPYVHGIETEQTGTTFVDLDTLLAESDAVAINAELTDETRGMIDAAAFDRMKDSTIVVNTSRGPIIREDALVEAVRAGDIAGAGLDVFEDEPLSPDSPLHDLDNVVLTPHSAAAVIESRERSIDLLARNVRRLVNGEPVSDRYLAVPP